MKYAVIEQTAGKVNVSKACRLLKVRRQGYYEYQARKGSPREVRDQLLTVKIKNIFYETGRIYGARKIREELRKGGDWVSRKRVRRLMDMSEQSEGSSRHVQAFRKAQIAAVPAGFPIPYCLCLAVPIACSLLPIACSWLFLLPIA